MVPRASCPCPRWDTPWRARAGAWPGRPWYVPPTVGQRSAHRRTEGQAFARRRGRHPAEPTSASARTWVTGRYRASVPKLGNKAFVPGLSPLLPFPPARPHCKSTWHNPPISPIPQIEICVIGEICGRMVFARPFCPWEQRSGGTNRMRVLRPLDAPQFCPPALRGRDTCSPRRGRWTRTESPTTIGSCGIEEHCSAPSGLGYRVGHRYPGRCRALLFRPVGAQGQLPKSQTCPSFLFQPYPFFQSRPV